MNRSFLYYANSEVTTLLLLFSHNFLLLVRTEDLMGLWGTMNIHKAARTMLNDKKGMCMREECNPSNLI
ncbi:hypothetical protein RIF29_04261 [Crotalaria pallida]|uniref:Uncharacterized protein n=1 Tax=Crotalaria pallida TaxID=3830 RepID=A0AAN9P9Y2_CROPI